MKGNTEQNSRFPNIISIYCPSPDVEFFSHNFLSGVCTWTETLVKIDHHPDADNMMSYKEN